MSPQIIKLTPLLLLCSIKVFATDYQCSGFAEYDRDTGKPGEQNVAHIQIDEKNQKFGFTIVTYDLNRNAHEIYRLDTPAPWVDYHQVKIPDSGISLVYRQPQTDPGLNLEYRITLSTTNVPVGAGWYYDGYCQNDDREPPSPCHQNAVYSFQCSKK